MAWVLLRIILGFPFGDSGLIDVHLAFRIDLDQGFD